MTTTAANAKYIDSGKSGRNMLWEGNFTPINNSYTIHKTCRCNAAIPFASHWSPALDRMNQWSIWWRTKCTQYRGTKNWSKVLRHAITVKSTASLQVTRIGNSQPLTIKLKMPNACGILWNALSHFTIQYLFSELHVYVFYAICAFSLSTIFRSKFRNLMISKHLSSLDSIWLTFHQTLFMFELEK
jgi:hypothetical protein